MRRLGDTSTEMGVSVPYQRNFQLGWNYDVRKFTELDHSMSNALEKCSQKNKTVRHFCLAKTLTDVCEVLDIPCEYGLKVRAGIVPNPVVEECLKDLHRNDCITMLFRIAFVRETRSKSLTRSQETPNTKESSRPPMVRQITSIDIGDELIVILKFHTTDLGTQNLQDLTAKITKIVTSRGELNDTTLPKLDDFLEKTEKKFSKTYFKDMSSSIRCGYFSKRKENLPTSLIGLVSGLKAFKEKCDNSVGSSESLDFQLFPRVMALTEEKENVVEDMTEHSGETSSFEDENGSPTTQKESDSEKAEMFYTKVVFEPYSINTSPGLDFNELFNSYVDAKTAEEKLEDYLTNYPYMSKAHPGKTKNMKDEISQKSSEIITTITELDGPNGAELDGPNGPLSKDVYGSNLVKDVEKFIQETSKTLPSGEDLRLLVLGKTGHGKSMTSLNILGLQGYGATGGADTSSNNSDNYNATYNRSDCGYAMIDGRLVQVVEAQSTKEDQKQFYSLSRVSALCPNGFHAILIVVEFSMKMTNEEVQEIEMIRKSLGKDVIEKYSMLVFTHGDEFHARYNGKKTFEAWCYEQDCLYTKYLLKELNYRSVLINNLEEDKTAMKRQIVQLISTVDEIVNSNEKNPYSNKEFKKAMSSRESLAKERGGYLLPKMRVPIIKMFSMNINSYQDSQSEQDFSQLQNKLPRIEGLCKDLDERVGTHGDPQFQLLQILQSLVVKLQNAQCKSAKSDAEKLESRVQELEKQEEEYEERFVTVPLPKKKYEERSVTASLPKKKGFFSRYF